jgi:hypothetical protein
MDVQERRRKQELVEVLPVEEEKAAAAQATGLAERPSAPLTLAQVAAANVAEADAAPESLVSHCPHLCACFSDLMEGAPPTLELWC